jgi:hypothetical protein
LTTPPRRLYFGKREERAGKEGNMPEGVVVTPDPIGSAPGAPGGEGVSQTPQLPEEFRPYSDIDWSLIPESNREDVLKGVKKFHGGMTRNQQEYKRLQVRVPELEERSRMLDQLVNEDWVKKAWDAHQKGQTPGEPPAPPLTEQFDPEQAAALQRMVDQKVSEIVGPLNHQLQSLHETQNQAKAKSELERMEAFASENGLPPPGDIMSDLYAQVSSGQATTVEQAYKMAMFPKLKEIAEERGRQSALTELQKKASSTVAPSTGPHGSPSTPGFTGRNAVLEAYRHTVANL